ncbi:MFS transporter [Panacagrimonas sp.]|uniref:MFS transporter n=1 Tax=Panacagrimonas sp. TaxID=2480088 RepID=UPI003B51B2FA
MAALKNPALWPIALIVFVDVLGFTVVIPLLPFYAQHLGATPMLVGALIATYALFSLFAAPLLGQWSDRRGRKPVLLLSQAGSLLGFVGLALAPSLLWLFAARALDGLTAGNLPAARAYISDVTAPADRAAAFGLIGAAFGFGYMVGPALAALLAPLGLQAPLWAAAGLALLSMLCTGALLPRGAAPSAFAAQARTARGELLSDPLIVRHLQQLFGFFAAFGLFTAGFALFCERRFEWQGEPFGAFEVGLALAHIGALGLLAQVFLLGPLVRRYGEARLVRACLLLAALGYLGLGWADNLPLLAACLSLTGVCNSLLRPSLLGLISQAVPATRQGAVFGLTQSLQSVAMLVSPLIAGGLIHFGWLAAWAAACALALLAALVTGRRMRSPHA